MRGSALDRGGRVPDIRPVDHATQADARALVLAGLGEHFGFVDESLNPDLDDIVGHYLRPGDDFLVGRVEGRVVATGALIREGASTGRIARMSVARAHRRQGLATLMLQRLRDIALSRGFHTLLVETNHDWHAAIALYRRFGFVEVARDAVSVHLRWVDGTDSPRAV